MKYRIETLDDSNGQWEPEPEGECNSIEEGEAMIADLRATLPERADTQMRVAVDTAIDPGAATECLNCGADISNNTHPNAVPDFCDTRCEDAYYAYYGED